MDLAPLPGGVPKRTLVAASTDEGAVTVISKCASAPKWTLQGRRRSRLTRSDSCPGPGEYDVSRARARSRRGPSFGRAPPKRNTGRLAVPETPSPGPVYNVSQAGASHVRGGAIGERVTARRRDDSAPGPAEYRLGSTLARSGPNLGQMAPRRRQHTEGPPLLFPNRPSSAPPSWSFGKCRRAVSDSAAGTAEVGDVAGAVQFMPPSTLRSSPAAHCDMAPRRAEHGGMFEVRPEPATYMIPSSTLGAHAHEFSKAMRPTSAPLRGPTGSTMGPGCYDPPMPAAPRVKGATAWHPRHQDQPVSHPSNPGPGSYDASMPRQRPRSATIPRAERAVSSRRAPDDNLGPAHYNVRVGLRHAGRRGPRFAAHGGSTRRPIEGLGPAGPGPGAYERRLADRARACSIGKSQRPEPGAGIANAPGPGAYDAPTDVCTRGCTIPSEERMPDNLDNGSPGPGYYKAYSSFR